MTTEYSRDAVDRWSRFVSYCSLVVALSALAWTLFGFGRLLGRGDASTDPLQSINARYEREAQLRKQENEKIREQWKEQQAEHINIFTKAANEQLEKHQGLLDELQSQEASYLALKVQAEAESLDVDSTDDDGEGQTATNDGVGDTEVAAESSPLPITPANGPGGTPNADPHATDPPLQPLLAYVHESRRPTVDTAAEGLLTVRNRGGSQAVLARIEFTPADGDGTVFEVDSAIAALGVEDNDDVLSIEFSETDNLAANEGKHGVYARQLGDQYVVPASNDVRIRLSVANSKHVGWGFYGSVKLEYNGIEPLTIEDAQIVFVAADDAIRRE